MNRNKHISPKALAQAKKRAQKDYRIGSAVSSSYHRPARSRISEAQQKMDQLDNLAAYNAFKHLYRDEYLEASSKGLSGDTVVMNLIRDDLRKGGSAIYNRAYAKSGNKMREGMLTGNLQSFLDSSLKGERLQVQNAFDVRRPGIEQRSKESRARSELGLAKQRQMNAARDQYIQGQIEGQGGLGRSDHASRYQAMKNIGAPNPLKALRLMDAGNFSGSTGMYQQEYDRLERQRKKEQQKKFGSEFDTLYNRSKSR